MALNPVLTSPVGTELNINVSVKKIIFFNESNYYGVCEVTSDQNHRFVATGKFAMSIFEGQCYNFEGKVVFHLLRRHLRECFLGVLRCFLSL